MKVVAKVCAGFRLPPVPEMPQAIYTLLLNTWAVSWRDRPTFSEVVEGLQKMAIDGTAFLDMCHDPRTMRPVYLSMSVSIETEDGGPSMLRGSGSNHHYIEPVSMEQALIPIRYYLSHEYRIGRLQKWYRV